MSYVSVSLINWCQSGFIHGMHWYSYTAPPPPLLILVSCLRCGFSPGCRAGTFGPHCKSRCSCINGGRCDFRTGTCHCPPGFIGANCSLSKSGNPLYWKSRRQNEIVTFIVINVGICSCVNEDMFVSAGCLSGFYGKDCAKLCSCGEGGQCHPATGKCICAPGRMGQSCQQGNAMLMSLIVTLCCGAMTPLSSLFSPSLYILKVSVQVLG